MPKLQKIFRLQPSGIPEAGIPDHPALFADGKVPGQGGGLGTEVVLQERPGNGGQLFVFPGILVAKDVFGVSQDMENVVGDEETPGCRGDGKAGAGVGSGKNGVVVDI